MDRALLSICIPTYNRKERLWELLMLIRKYNVEKIPILVFDNASTDGTQEKVKHLADSGEIIYFRNKENLGHDGNFLRMVEEGRKYAKYSLWLGDDDRLLADFFYDIPMKLQKDNLDMIVLNSVGYNNNFIKRNLKKLLNKNNLIAKNTTLSLQWDTHYIDEKAFLINYYDKLPFGTLVVNNDLLSVEKSKRYLGTYHLYGGAVWEMLDEQTTRNGRICVLMTAKPYIVWGKGAKSYSSIMENVCRGIGNFLSLLPHNLQSIVYQSTVDMVAAEAYGENSKYVLEEYLKNLRINDERAYREFIAQ